MDEPVFHIAQANIARVRAPLYDPIMRGFMEQHDYINSVADRAPGFIWRLQTGTSTGVFDPRDIVNISVWESIEALSSYVFDSDHRGPLRDRREWFVKIDGPQSVLWWVSPGTTPGLSEAKRRLDLLAERGPTADAFTFTERFPPPAAR